MFAIEGCPWTLVSPYRNENFRNSSKFLERQPKPCKGFENSREPKLTRSSVFSARHPCQNRTERLSGQSKSGLRPTFRKSDRSGLSTRDGHHVFSILADRDPSSDVGARERDKSQRRRRQLFFQICRPVVPKGRTSSWISDLSWPQKSSSPSRLTRAWCLRVTVPTSAEIRFQFRLRARIR